MCLTQGITPIVEDKAILNIDLEQTTGFLLLRTANLWQRKIEEVVAPLDLTRTQFFVLSMSHFLAQKGEPVSQASLAAYSGFDAMMLSQVARRLENKGYLDRVTHPDDSRAKSLVLTEAGLKKMISARRAVKQAWQAFIGQSQVLDDQLKQALDPLCFL